MNTNNKIQTVTGSFQFFTCKTGRGRDRYCVKVSGMVTADDGKQYPCTVQAFDDWDGKLPAALSAIVGNTYTDPETGLHRSVKGSLKGTVKVPAGTPIAEKQGTVTTFHQIDVSVDAFTCEKTNQKFVEFK
jgi:hypothetical protein